MQESDDDLKLEEEKQIENLKPKSPIQAEHVRAEQVSIVRLEIKC